MNTLDLSNVFTHIYENDVWGQGRCKSGGGSLPQATASIRAALPTIFRTLNVRVLVDAPCGVAHWIKECTRDIDLYFGYDIVRDAVLSQVSSSVRLNHFYAIGDVTKDVFPRADAILCRDCLVHLPNELALQALKNFRMSGSRYLLATTYDVQSNKQIAAGSWRVMNLSLPPFSLPAPIHVVDERDGKGKLLGVYYLPDWSRE
jgi:hypothetical protein